MLDEGALPLSRCIECRIVRGMFKLTPVLSVSIF